MAVHFDHEGTIGRETFVRGDESLTVECLGVELVLEFEGAPAESLRFSNPVDSVFFKSDLDRELLRSGWTLTRHESAPRPARSSVAHPLGAIGTRN